MSDRADLPAADPSGMLEAVLALPAQCRDGYERGRGAAGLPDASGLSAVAICGMGGSGVSGDLIRALYRTRLGIPVVSVKEPVLPEFCGRDTLVVCSSYSGDTAETLACFDQATERGCRLVVVASGGEISSRAGERGAAVVEIPGGLQPRAAIGYLALGALGALDAMGLVPGLESDLEEVVRVLEGVARESGGSRNPAEERARLLHGLIPVIWGAEGIAAVAAARWKTDLNENAKVPAFASSLPELGHNEVVGWAPGQGQGFAVVVLRSGEEPELMASLVDASRTIAGEAGFGAWMEVSAAGTSSLARALSLIMMGSATSVYLAYLRGVDPGPIEAIARLKDVLRETRAES